MTKGRSHLLNAYHAIDALLGAFCAFLTLFFPIALQELVLLLSSPFYKRENSASQRLGTWAGMTWLISSGAGTQTHTYGTSQPSLYFT